MSVDLASGLAAAAGAILGVLAVMKFVFGSAFVMRDIHRAVLGDPQAPADSTDRLPLRYLVEVVRRENTDQHNEAKQDRALVAADISAIRSRVERLEMGA